MPTRLYFADKETLAVDEDVEAVEAAFGSVAPNPAPLAQFTQQGEKVFVNVALVRYFCAYAPNTGPPQIVRKG